MSLSQDIWRININVREYLVAHYTPYDGDEAFLAPPTARTLALWQAVKSLMQEERTRGGIYEIDNTRISTITSHAPGYIDRDLEQIVGIQTDTPLKRAIMPFGGIRMVQSSLKAYQRELPADIQNVFNYRKTHNDGVFDAYTDEMKLARHNGIITGLPDAYGRGRIIGDYRRLPLYGIDFLIAHKEAAKARHVFDAMDLEAIQLREEISEQIRALQELKAMAAAYGFDISQPAQDTKEAIQWLYFAYLAAVKEQNGAAMSI
ncbi:MAG: pyruvate formate lyase family protein, partial [Kiritimatiellia bacterium]|nr:pyruvate formate lyase family protein [Kiritimatiellia bacterium]